MKVRYNAPVALTFTIASAAALILNQTIAPGLIPAWFAVGGKGSFNPALVRSWITLFTHVLGQADWNQMLSNSAFILLLGPILEENYNSRQVLVMIVLTALVSGALNLLFFTTPLSGSGGVVFMMILLASVAGFSKGEIPLTFILALAIYLGRECIHTFSAGNLSEFTRILGGFCGSLVGFFRPGRKR